MQKPFLALSCALAATWVFAAPSPRWAPMNTDIVIVGEGPGKADPAIETAWRKAFKDEGLDFGKNEDMTMAQLGEVSPHLPALVKAFGVSDDLKTMPAWSAVYSCALPTTAEQLKGDDFPEGMALRLFIENSEIDVPALDKAMAALCAEKRGDMRITCTFGRSGEWRTLSFASGEKGKVPTKMFAGYRPVAGGLAAIVCASQPEADAWITGRAPTLPSNSPLRSAFTPVESSRKDWVRVRVGDLAGLVARFSTPEARKEMAIKMPLLQKPHMVDLAFALKGINYVLTLSATTRDEASATQLRDFLLGWKGLASQMFLPMLTQKPDSALAALANAIVCEASGNAVSLRLEVTPTMGAKAFRECQKIAVQQAAQASLNTASDEEDEDVEDEDEEDDTPMSEEEARKLLKGLEAK